MTSALDESLPVIPAVLPTLSAIERAESSLPTILIDEGIGLERLQEHFSKDIILALNGSSLSPNYYGFVTGGVTPAALIADRIVSLYDQNVQVHLPQESIATRLEDTALRSVYFNRLQPCKVHE